MDSKQELEILYQHLEAIEERYKAIGALHPSLVQNEYYQRLLDRLDAVIATAESVKTLADGLV